MFLTEMRSNSFSGNFLANNRQMVFLLNYSSRYHERSQINFRFTSICDRKKIECDAIEQTWLSGAAPQEGSSVLVPTSCL